MFRRELNCERRHDNISIQLWGQSNSLRRTVLENIGRGDKWKTAHTFAPEPKFYSCMHLFENSDSRSFASFSFSHADRVEKRSDKAGCGHRLRKKARLERGRDKERLLSNGISRLAKLALKTIIFTSKWILPFYWNRWILGCFAHLHGWESSSDELFWCRPTRIFLPPARSHFFSFTTELVNSRIQFLTEDEYDK